VGLSPSLAFVAVVIWTWVIGPIGALLAIPLSLLARAVLVEADPSLHWVLPVLSNKDELPPDDPEPSSDGESGGRPG
jgi:AI-2 transport protein TqsA